MAVKKKVSKKVSKKVAKKKGTKSKVKRERYDGNDDGFQTVSGAKEYITLSECEEGDVLVTGRYIGRGPKDRYKKRTYQFDREDGSPIVVMNKNGSMHHIFDEDPGIPVGSWVRIIYEGMDTLQKGDYEGSDFHKLKVQVSKKLSKVTQNQFEEEEVEEVEDEDEELDAVLDEEDDEEELDEEELDEEEDEDEEDEDEEEEEVAPPTAKSKPKPKSTKSEASKKAKKKKASKKSSGKKVTKKKSTKSKKEVEDDDFFDDEEIEDLDDLE